MNLSKNLTLEEVTYSPTAEKMKIKNDQMSDEVLANLKALAENIFQPTRDKLGPIRVSSGYRSPELNKAIGGSTTSQHCNGEALDLQAIAATNKDIFNFIKSTLVFDQLIWEFGTSMSPEWVHVSFRRRGNNRKQILKSVKTNGKTTYQPWPNS